MGTPSVLTVIVNKVLLGYSKHMFLTIGYGHVLRPLLTSLIILSSNPKYINCPPAMVVVLTDFGVCSNVFAQIGSLCTGSIKGLITLSKSETAQCVTLCWTLHSASCKDRLFCTL